MVHIPLLRSASQLPDLCDCKSPFTEYLDSAPNFGGMSVPETVSVSSPNWEHIPSSVVVPGVDSPLVQAPTAAFALPVCISAPKASMFSPMQTSRDVSSLGSLQELSTWFAHGDFVPLSIPLQAGVVSTTAKETQGSGVKSMGYFRLGTEYIVVPRCEANWPYDGLCSSTGSSDSENGGRDDMESHRNASKRHRTDLPKRQADVLWGQCDHLLKKLEAGGAARTSALADLSGSVRSYTLHHTGCRVVQRAIEVCDHEAFAGIVHELRGFVRRAVASPHGNYVIQKVVKELPVSRIAFVAEELHGVGAKVACTKFGCRVMCRLVEHAVEEASTKKLVDEMLEDVNALCVHTFGHHVVEAILEHGLPYQKEWVASALCGAIPFYARGCSSSFVLESALKHCSADGQEAIASLMLNDELGLISLAEHENGFRCVRALLRFPAGVPTEVSRVVQQNTLRLRKNHFGRRLIDELKCRCASAL